MEYFFLVTEVISYVIAGSSLIVAVTPTPKDDAILAKIKGFFAVIGLSSVGGAKGL